MSSSGPLRPHPAASEEEEEDRKMAAVGLSSSRGSGLISSRVGQQQVVATERRNTTTGKAGKSRRTTTTVATRTTSAMTSTRTVSDFVFNFHFLLSIVLLIILGGDWTTLREGGGVWAEEMEHFDPAGRGTLMFGDKCESTTDCGFAGSVCDPGTRTCQCTSDLSATNHLDKCGKKAQVNESCFFTEQCEQMTEQTECRDGRCICRFEMNPIFKPDGTVECRATLNKPIVPEKYIDPTMIGVLVAMAVMFIIICVVLRLFSNCPRTPGELVDYLLSKNAIQNVIFVNGSVTVNSGAEGGTESETGSTPCSTEPPISSCLGVTLSGVYQLSVGSLVQCVYCECSPPFPTRVPAGECWLQAQRNDGADKVPQKDFYLRTWTEYQNGFGSPDGDHWLGLDALNLITANGPEMRMLYEVGYVDELIVPAFQIDNAQNLYRVVQPTSEVSSDLQVIAYDAPFSTIDEDNLNNPFGQPSEFYGGYWYGSPSTILNINNEPLSSGRIKRMYIKF